MNGKNLILLLILVSGISFVGGITVQWYDTNTLWNKYLKKECYVQHVDAFRGLDQYWCKGERIVIYTKPMVRK